MTTRRHFMYGGIAAAGAAKLSEQINSASVPPLKSTQVVRDRATLTRIDTNEHRFVYLAEGGRCGWFAFVDQDMASACAEDPLQGIYIASSADRSGRLGAWVRNVDGFISPSWFGAVGDSKHDDTAALQSAIDASQRGGHSLSLPYGRYRITSGLTVQHSITIESDGAEILFAANTADAALTIAANPGSHLSRPRILGHLVIEKADIDWSVPSHGLKIQNAYMGEFHVSVLNFQRGIWLHADGTGCVYNELHVSQLTNNKYSTFLDVSGPNSWCNQNTFWGGRYSNGINQSGTHIRLDDSIYPLNGNCWMRPSLEAVSDSYSLFDLRGRHNAILHPRCEHSGSPEYYGSIGGRKNEVLAHSAPYLTKSRVRVDGQSHRVETSVGTSWQFQGSYQLERRGPGPVISLQNKSVADGLEILDPAGERAVHIPADGTWSVHGEKKILWRSAGAPATGQWSRGDIAFVDQPEADGQLGWVCIEGGAPGVWKEFGVIGASTAANVSAPSGGGTIDTECREQLTQLLVSLKDAGMME